MKTTKVVAPPIVFHEMSARDEGREAFVAILVTVVGFALFGGIFFWFWPAERFFFAILFAVVGLMAGAIGRIAYVHLRSPGKFVCFLNSQRIYCHIPVPGCGDEFDLPLNQIAHLEQHIDDGTTHWTLCTAKGERYELTRNYSNPAQEIIEELRKLRPELKVIDVR